MTVAEELRALAAKYADVRIGMCALDVERMESALNEMIEQSRQAERARVAGVAANVVILDEVRRQRGVS